MTFNSGIFETFGIYIYHTFFVSLESKRNSVRLSAVNDSTLSTPSKNSTQGNAVNVTSQQKFDDRFDWLTAWISRNMATIILWFCYLLLIIGFRACGLSPFFLLLSSFLFKVPGKATPAFTELLQKIIPEFILYPRL